MPRKYLLIVFMALLLAGCVSVMDSRRLNVMLRNGDCAGALSFMGGAKSDYGANQELLYYMDAAMVNLRCGQYDASNAMLHKASDLGEELWTKSITREAATFIINDYTREYSGEDFELAMINLLSALNYSVKGDFGEALVEVRRLNSRLTQLNDKYDQKNVYSEDAFGQYLSALIYEAEGGGMQSLDSAFINYMKAYSGYGDYRAYYSTPMPRIFMEDFARVGKAVGRSGDLPGDAPDAVMSNDEARKKGRIVMVHLNGLGPFKAEDRVTAAGRAGVISIAFPRFVVRPPSCNYSALIAEGSGGSYRGSSELVEDINRIATKNLEDRKGRVVAKTIARAAIKQVAVQAAAQSADSPLVRDLIRVGGGVMAAATERADTRSWQTLPGEIRLSRVYVEPGKYRVVGSFCGSERVIGQDVEVGPGETKFVILDTMY